MWVPSKTKFKKSFKGKMRRIASKGDRVAFGDYALKSLGYSRMASNQFEASRRILVKHLGKNVKIIARIFPHIPVSKKPTDVRMGKGKGSVDKYIFRVIPGRILFDVSGCQYSDIRDVLDKFSAKLSIECKITAYEDV